MRQQFTDTGAYYAEHARKSLLYSLGDQLWEQASPVHSLASRGNSRAVE